MLANILVNIFTIKLVFFVKHINQWSSTGKGVCPPGANLTISETISSQFKRCCWQLVGKSWGAAKS